MTNIFMLNLLILLISLCTIYYVFVYFCYRLIWSVSWIKKLYDKKEEIVKSKKAPRIIFAGGSNVLFSIQAELIENRTKLPAINFGIASGVQTDYFIHKLKKVISENDILILPLEYSFLLFDGTPSEIKKDLVRTYDRSFFYGMPLSLQMEITIKTNLLNMFKDYFLAIKYRNIKRKINLNPDATNEYGDYMFNIGSDIFLEKYNSKYYSPVLIQNEGFHETRGLFLLKDFNNWCKERNISLYISFATTVFFPAYDTQKYKEYFQFLLNYYKDNCMNVIGTPHDFFYEPNSFYDSRYHLNNQAAEKNTEKYIDELNKRVFV